MTVSSSPRYFALIPAAGSGQRFSATAATLSPKQYQRLGNATVLEHSLRVFAAHSRIAGIYLVVSPGDQLIAKINLPPKVKLLRVGGASRHASVLNGLQAMAADCAAHDWVLVHDAARPGLTGDLVTRLIDVVGDDPAGGLLAMPLADTLKREDDGRSSATLPRAHLWQAQTPQMFQHGSLQDALQHAQQSGQEVTDEASAIEALGLQPKLVPGSLRNMKITYAQELDIVAKLMELK
ncbi:MAG: 2-C-methyl-D-erythritol 4-phosphate cytidylyltransferase [Burkholderiaceae bacterium]|nr:MAG: 2-C-methyl-D-erythritol 4-phosphate cytidylyltransferase [Burkholderiaceae bacterium]